MSHAKKHFYADGLHFECTGCGDCCRFGDGFVYVSDEDIRYLAHELNLTLSQFADKFLEVHEEQLVLRSSGDDCIFFQDDRCQVYSVRPTQCRTYPFWPANMKSQYRWKIVAGECEGIGRGRPYSRREIEEILAQTRETDQGPAESNIS